MAAVAAARTWDKEVPPITVAERTYLTKCPYKRQKKSPMPAPIPQAAAPAAVPAPVPLVAVNKAVARAPVEKKSPPVLPAMPAVVPASFSLDEPINPSGILVKVVGTEMSCQGCLCKEHEICGKVLKEDEVVRLHKMQLMVEGKEETAIASIWVTDCINCCRAGFVPCHMVRQAARYNRALARVTCIFSGDPETCDTAEQRLFFKNKSFSLALIIFTLPESTMQF